MASAADTSKPKRIKALLSSFLKGTFKEGKGKCDIAADLTDGAKKITDEDTNSGLADENEGFVVIDEWTPTNIENSSTVQPQNLASFFRRVETFSTSTWFAKPPEVSPLHCARYGWENIDENSLKCVSCKEVVYGGLPPKWELQAYKKEIQRLQESLKTGHRIACPWSSNPCPASFSEVQFENRSKAEGTFKERVASVRCFSLSVPAIDKSSMIQFYTEEAELSDGISRLVTGVLGEEPTSDYKERIEAVVCIALCGWSRSSAEGSSSPTMMCDFCRRKIGLWNFTSVDKSRPPQTPVDSPEPASKRFKVDRCPFDPVKEHRTWCPWIKLSSGVNKYRTPVKGSKGDKDAPLRPSWQQLLTLLLLRTNSGSQNSDGLLTNKDSTPPSEAWKVVRRITNFWQSRNAERKT